MRREAGSLSPHSSALPAACREEEEKDPLNWGTGPRVGGEVWGGQARVSTEPEQD